MFHNEKVFNLFYIFEYWTFLHYLLFFILFSEKMAQLKQQLPLQMPDLSSLRITTAVSMLGKAYGCGQCSGKFFN